MFSIKTKLIFIYTLLFGILLTLVAFGTLFIMERVYISKVDGYIISYSAIVADKIPGNVNKEFLNEEALRLLSQEEKQQLMETFRIFRHWSDAPLEIHIQAVGANGKLLLKDKLLSTPQRLQRINEKWSERRLLVTEEISGTNYRVYRLRIGTNHADSPPPLLIEAAASLGDLVRLRYLVFHRHLLIILAALLIAGLASYFMSKYSFKPVSQMVKTAAEISASNLDRRLELPKAKDEIHLLGKTLNDMIDRIAHAFKLQQQFVADASHEIRTPLTVIQAELELALNQVEQPAVRESIEVSLLELKHLTELTSALLTLARLDALENTSNNTSNNTLSLETVSISEILLEAVQGLQVIAAGKQVTLHLTGTDESNELKGDRRVGLKGDRQVKVDSQKIKKMLVNIIENAVKYSSAGGEVHISLESRTREGIQITVTDQGAGISAKALPHIFDRFYRAPELRNKTMGSGLGLAIAKKIAQLHQGEITVHSEPGKGSTFTVKLPAWI